MGFLGGCLCARSLENSRLGPPATRRDGVDETPFKRQPGHDERNQPPNRTGPRFFIPPHRGAAP
jgi:hypothetical protein